MMFLVRRVDGIQWFYFEGLFVGSSAPLLSRLAQAVTLVLNAV
jgi:hypothetical protein